MASNTPLVVYLSTYVYEHGTPIFLWACAIPIIFLYFSYETFETWRKGDAQSEIPLVGPWATYLPRIVLNAVYATSATNLLQSGYEKFKHGAFRILRIDGNIVILPQDVLEELSSLPSTVVSPHGALEKDLLGPHTGIDLILESRLHHTIVQRKLTPRLPLLTPALEIELSSAVEEHFPACDDWTEFQPYQVLAKISARISARALVGPELCRNKTWLDVSVNYTECLFRTIVVLRMFPTWMHSSLRYALPSFWGGKNYLYAGKALLRPVIEELIQKNNDGLWSPQTTEQDMNVLSWLADTAKGHDRDADTLAHVEILLALASVHTTLLRMVNVLYDLTADSQCAREIESEIADMQAHQPTWTPASYDKLGKLDSVLRESQRMSPPTTLGMKRLFKETYTFANGLRIEEGTYVCLPIYAIENDPENAPDPSTFDGLRNYQLRQQLNESSRREEYLFSTPEPTALNFGYGKTACPGRYFASLIIKMVFVKLLTEYDFKFLDGKQRPKSIMAHEFLFCWPWQKMLIKRKQNTASPF
ncbi:hypothetical protein HBH64_162160 [Parastagonospora nodorum]|nr:hypothetical protein HBH52_136770 [Parastagonospora nodorum]KAH4034044.1 hypothetical protein HBI09_116070 [Parastagonospora nodorum]KAH4046598.1 hypothetical protein HBH49_185450 [Parastagonospora nodorum]KAH4062048.1 hypothetical protein HBH50_213660 [Parastagonospora nodorum]KAH4088656.1 hypothetical protein HBH48_117310 [Parastagonospora nodorum]